MAKVGTEDGERCNRPNGDGFACDGTMMPSVGENCSCHINPPCSSCVDAPLVCTVCEATGEDE